MMEKNDQWKGNGKWNEYVDARELVKVRTRLRLVWMEMTRMIMMVMKAMMVVMMTGAMTIVWVRASIRFGVC